MLVCNIEDLFQGNIGYEQEAQFDQHQFKYIGQECAIVICS